MTRILSFQATWTCRHSGACCASAWPIPVEPRSERAIRDGLAAGRLQIQPRRIFEAAPDLPDQAESVLAHDAGGRCVFFAQSTRLCAIHRDLGHEALPLACRQFPRVAVLGADSVSLTLSHYCPTAVALLFEPAAPVAIVENPSGFPADGEYDGLDARAALPPLLRPGVLTTLATHAVFEAHGVARLTREELGVRQAVSELVATAAALARWTPADGEWEAYARGVLQQPPARPAVSSEPRALWETVVAAIPDPSRRPSFLSPREADRGLFESREWEFAAPVKRYLAAKLFASWSAYQGNGLATTARLVEAALAVVQIECARRGESSLDRPALQQALRRSDRLLVHLVDPAALARRLDALPGG